MGFINEIFLKKFEEQEKRFPNRHKEIHKAPCEHCPAVVNKRLGIIDPEDADIGKLPKATIAKEHLFTCGWRPNKLCKGHCDDHGIDEEFIKSITSKNRR